MVEQLFLMVGLIFHNKKIQFVFIGRLIHPDDKSKALKYQTLELVIIRIQISIVIVALKTKEKLCTQLFIDQVLLSLRY